MLKRYWSCGRIADWIRGTPTIRAGTSKEWEEWENAAKNKHPIRWWLAEVALSSLEDIVFYIPDKINNLKYYISNRWIIHTHALVADSKYLKPGNWYDTGDKFLYCLFNELKDFVEIEVASDYCFWSEEAKEKFNMPTYFKWVKRWRCPAAGLESITERSQAEGQKESQKEILELYNWWVNVYPNRPDPYEVSGWNDYSTEHDVFSEEITSCNREKLNAIHAELAKLEKEYKDEEEAMMIRLIRVRNSLWT